MQTEQDSRFLQGVHKMREEFLKGLLTRTKCDVDKVTLMKSLFSDGNVNFNTLRRTITEASQLCDNPSNLSSDGLDSEILRNEKLGRIINEIEKVIEKISADITEGKSPKFILRNQKMWNNCLFGESLKLKKGEASQKLVIDYRLKNSKQKFIIMMHFLSVIYQMIIKHMTCTRRELYYQNIDLVKNQSAVDTTVRDICCLLDVPPWELGILATSKGLIAGPLEMVTKEGHLINCLNSGGVLIPHDVIGLKSIKSDAKFILVIEKDATFQKLIDDGALHRLRPCIILTGKGYPDVNTRLMLKCLVDNLRVPSLALVDCDPYGIEIMCIYKYGSLAMSHISEKLTVPSLLWLGIHPTDVSQLGTPSMPLTDSDIAKCKDIMSRPYCFAGSRLHEQLVVLLEGNFKTELEGVDTISRAYLTDRYIQHKISTGDYI